MTLLYTEISQDLPGHGRCVLFAADRRITTPAGGPPRHYKKLVDIPYLNAALGFFGLAEFRRSQTGFRMSDHLREFVRAQAGTTSLALFAKRLATSLNSFVPSSLRRSERSGIHISGMTGDSLPEFWFVRNLDDTGQPTLGKYEADEQYLTRDARNDGFDGKDPATLPPHGRLYRNGDILSHVAAWEAIDKTLGRLRNVSAFSPIRSPSEYADWVRFKMEVLLHFQKRFAKTLLVGGPVDIIVKSRIV
jgi:hypothetical protein